MKNVIILLFLFLPFGGFSQGENNNWYFGNEAAINFAGSPTATFNSQMNQLEGVASISDWNGNLLFYTNGVDVWNRQHQIMLNGTGLTGNDSAQQVLIVPYPSMPNLYYIFTTSIATANTPVISFSIVDMDLGTTGLNGLPLGGIITGQKNIAVLDGNNQTLTGTEAITSTLNSTNSGYWLLIPNGSLLYSYIIDSTGFNNDAPVLSNLSLPTPLAGFGEIKVSPKLPSGLSLPYTNFVSITRWNNPYDISINSFNNATGQLTNHYQVLVGGTESYSTEFSSDGLLMYSSNRGGNLYAYDLFAVPPNFIKTIVSNFGHIFTCLQRAKNNEIYLSVDTNVFVARITNSNSFLGSGLSINDIDIRPKNCNYGLPQLIPKITNSNCMQNLTLSDTEDYNEYSYLVIDNITTNGNYINNNNKITFSAGSSISLEDKTHIKGGADFLGKIDGCSVLTTKSTANSNQPNINYVVNVDKTNQPKITLYPNPAKDEITIFSKDLKITKVSIFSIDGKIIYNSTVENSNSSQIQVSNFYSGIYLINVELENGEIFQDKVIVK